MRSIELCGSSEEDRGSRIDRSEQRRRGFRENRTLRGDLMPTLYLGLPAVDQTPQFFTESSSSCSGVAFSTVNSLWSARAPLAFNRMMEGATAR